MLTDRQLDVLGLLARGLTYERTGELLGISLHTVKEVAHGARSRLQARNTAHAVAIALREGLIVP